MEIDKSFISAYLSKLIGWIRIPRNGIGVHYKNLKFHSLLFSERNGFTKFFKIGNWIIKFLNK